MCNITVYAVDAAISLYMCKSSGQVAKYRLDTFTFTHLSFVCFLTGINIIITSSNQRLGKCVRPMGKNDMVGLLVVCLIPNLVTLHITH